jgi:plastocyanin
MVTGDPVNWAPTKTGSHTITLRAVDSLGYGATDSISFNIVP